MRMKQMHRRILEGCAFASFSYDTPHSRENILTVGFPQLFSITEGNRKILPVYQTEGLTVNLADIIHVD